MKLNPRFVVVVFPDRFPVEVVVTEKQAYQERVNNWCLAVPPRCSAYKIKFRTVNKTVTLKKERVVFECCGNWCFIVAFFSLLSWVYIYQFGWNYIWIFWILSNIDGYAKNKAGNACKPVCLECKHGVCVGPERCKCDLGFFGPACDISEFSNQFLTSKKTLKITWNSLIFNRFQSVRKVIGDGIAHINAIANTTVFVINLTGCANVQRAIGAIDVKWNVRAIDTVWIVRNHAVVQMVENVITFLANVLVLPVSPVHCVPIAVQRAHMAKTVNQSANARTKADVNHRLANANVHPAGKVNLHIF